MAPEILGGVPYGARRRRVGARRAAVHPAQRHAALRLRRRPKGARAGPRRPLEPDAPELGRRLARGARARRPLPPGRPRPPRDGGRAAALAVQRATGRWSDAAAAARRASRSGARSTSSCARARSRRRWRRASRRPSRSRRRRRRPSWWSRTRARGACPGVAERGASELTAAAAESAAAAGGVSPTRSRCPRSTCRHPPQPVDGRRPRPGVRGPRRESQAPAAHSGASKSCVTCGD